MCYRCFHQICLVFLITKVGPLPSTNKLFLPFLALDDKLLSTTKIIAFPVKSSLKLYQSVSSNIIP